MVHISYRPKGKSKPLAFVGKGVTFDSGGLDLKPTSGMRWMKKDMGGSAAIVGLAYWAVESKSNQAMDFYIPMAESVLDRDSFRPSDVYVTRNGMTVEIDNTDAEGRLLLCEAIDVAVNQKAKDKPAAVIDVATLTGAIKAGLGTEVCGFFSNDLRLSHQLEESSISKSDKIWRMPLFQAYRSALNSSIADITNSASGFGGAVRAALFLKEFVGDTPWAHLDIYAWSDSAKGPLLEKGGSGQAVQCLIGFVENFEKI